MRTPILIFSLLLGSAPAFAAKPCDELKTEIAAQIEANHVSSYTLEVVANDQVGERTVVGSCDGGTNKIVYTRGTAAPASSAPQPAATAPANPETTPPAPAPKS